ATGADCFDCVKLAKAQACGSARHPQMETDTRRFAFFHIPSAQNKRTRVPWVIVQMSVLIGFENMMQADGNREPPTARTGRVKGVRIEQPVTLHVDFAVFFDRRVWR